MLKEVGTNYNACSFTRLMVENSATSSWELAAEMAFTIPCSAIAILFEVEYWRSLGMDFDPDVGISQAPGALASVTDTCRDTDSAAEDELAEVPLVAGKVEERRPDGEF